MEEVSVLLALGCQLSALSKHCAGCPAHRVFCDAWGTRQLVIALDLGFLERPAYEALERESYQVLGLLDRLLDSLSKKLRDVRGLHSETLKL